MNRLLMVSGLVLLLGGCATDRASMRGTAVQMSPSEAYVQAVEREARRRGVMVYWLNKPADKAMPQVAGR